MSEFDSLPEFMAWLKDCQDELAVVQELLSERISDNPTVLAEQLSKIDAWHGRMTKLLADANAHLDLAERQAYYKVDKELFADEQKVNVAAEVWKERRLRDIIEGICKSIQNRCILGMASMKRNTGERGGS